MSMSRSYTSSPLWHLYGNSGVVLLYFCINIILAIFDRLFIKSEEGLQNSPLSKTNVKVFAFGIY
jgi:hypothetical protein